MPDGRYRVQSVPLSKEAAEGLRNTILDRAAVLDDALEVIEIDEWEPDKANLRDEETTDEIAHAVRNLEQLRMAEEVDDV